MRRLAARPTAQCAGAASFWCSDYRCVHQCYPSSTTCTLAPHLWQRSLAPPCCHLWCCHPRLQTTHTTTTNATAYQVWINAGLILPVVVTALFSILRRARAGLGEAEGQDSGHLGGSCAPSFPSPHGCERTRARTTGETGARAEEGTEQRTSLDHSFSVGCQIYIARRQQ